MSESDLDTARVFLDTAAMLVYMDSDNEYIERFFNKALDLIPGREMKDDFINKHDSSHTAILHRIDSLINALTIFRDIDPQTEDYQIVLDLIDNHITNLGRGIGLE